jgi:hypothetical protein
MATGSGAAGEVLSDEPAENQLPSRLSSKATLPGQADSPPVEVPIGATPEAILQTKKSPSKQKTRINICLVESQGADTETAVGEGNHR